MRTVKFLVIGAMLYLGGGSAAAQDQSIAINARVKTICKVDIHFNPPLRYAAGINHLGQITELCNNVEGYILVLDHPRGMTGAALLLDGQRVEIADDANRTVIVDSRQPAFKQREVGLELAQMAEIMPMIIYAEPKGMVF